MAGSSLADNSFTYDFENLALGQDLVGQDGWSQVANWFSPVILTGPGVNPSLTAARNTPAHFTQDSVLQNINLGLTPNGQGNYQTSTIQIRMDTDTGGTYLDNINLQGVPEPSTYAMGVLGGPSLRYGVASKNLYN